MCVKQHNSTTHNNCKVSQVWHIWSHLTHPGSTRSIYQGLLTYRMKLKDRVFALK